MSVAAQLFADDHWDGHMGWGGGWWMVIWGTLMMIGFAGFVVWLVRTAAMRPGTHHDMRPGDPLDRAREILAERYARGELTSDEYRERVDQLG